VALFQTGRSGAALVTGPMAEVVQHSTQHWQAADLQAMARYLQQLPRHTATDRPAAAPTRRPRPRWAPRSTNAIAHSATARKGKGPSMGKGISLTRPWPATAPSRKPRRPTWCKPC
jgi:hypothetical protein